VASTDVIHLHLEIVMKKLATSLIAAVLALAVLGPNLAQANHAPHYPKKDHPALRHHKAAHKACKKAKAMEVKHGLFH